MFSVESFQSHDGTEIRYGKLSSGEPATNKPVLIYLPGMGGSVKSVLWFLEALQEYFDPIYGLDLRGFGLNYDEHQPLKSFRPALADIRYFIQTVLPQTATDLHLCGISLGSTIATILAYQYPTRFKSLLLLSPAYRPHPKTFSWHYKLKNIVGKLILGKRYRTKLPFRISMLTQNPRILNDPQYQNAPMPQMMPELLVSARHLCIEGLDKIALIQTPTMMVIPEKDQICDPKAMHLGYERIPPYVQKCCLSLPNDYHNVLMEEGAQDILRDYIAWHQSLSTLTPNRPTYGASHTQSS